IPTGKNLFPNPLGDCSKNCSVSVKLSIPYCHKIYLKIGSKLASRDLYRQILNPKIATALRSRPKNTTRAVPARLAIGASSQRSTQPKTPLASKPTSQAVEYNSQASSQANLSSQRQIRSQPSILGTRRTTGELLDSDSNEEVLPSIVVRK
ncbi:hypothetical protein BKA56DRAFT_589795, partial [Ilyonectria sp. MPI-CAGE-AT-0026]